MEKFVDFMSGLQGRILRLVVGAGAVVAGLYISAGAWHWVLIALGAVLILSGILKVCGLNLLVGRPITAHPDK